MDIKPDAYPDCDEEAWQKEERSGRAKSGVG